MLPTAWGRDKLVALPRSPQELWLYWELSASKVDEALRAGGSPRAELHLRYADGGRHAAELPCDLAAGRALLRAPTAGRSYYAELGLKRLGRPFALLLRSNEVLLPHGRPEPAGREDALELPEELRRFRPPPRDA